jgi:hypothetical protein
VRSYYLLKLFFAGWSQETKTATNGSRESNSQPIEIIESLVRIAASPGRASRLAGYVLSREGRNHRGNNKPSRNLQVNPQQPLHQHSSDFRLLYIMSYDRLNSLEAQPTTWRRDDDPQFQDDPEFARFTENLSNQLFTLTSNISNLSRQIALLGTKRDTERVRERVHNLLEETRSGFKDAGEAIKKVQTWEDVNVGHPLTMHLLIERL